MKLRTLSTSEGEGNRLGNVWSIEGPPIARGDDRDEESGDDDVDSAGGDDINGATEF